MNTKYPFSTIPFTGLTKAALKSTGATIAYYVLAR